MACAFQPPQASTLRTALLPTSLRAIVMRSSSGSACSSRSRRRSSLGLSGCCCRFGLLLSKFVVQEPQEPASDSHLRTQRLLSDEIREVPEETTRDPVG
eukprot:340343-Hanusia_phi.AAC.1